MASRPACLPSVAVLPVGLPSCRGIFSRSRGGFLKGCNFWPFLAVFGRFEGISRAWRGFPWVRLRLGLCGAFCGCYSFCLRAVSTCKGKKAAQIQKIFLPSFLPLWPYNRQKETAFVGSFPLWVVLWGWVSPIERKYRRLQAGFPSSLLPLFCRVRSVCLWRWGLLCNISYCGLWPPCGSCNCILLLSFSWCRGFRVQTFFCIPPLWRCISPLGQNRPLSLFGLSVPFFVPPPLCLSNTLYWRRVGLRWALHTN